MKTATLTPLEQKVYFAAKNSPDGVIFLETIESWKLTGKNTLQFTLSQMVQKGWLLRLRRGVYLAGEPESNIIQDAFYIATYIYPGYIAFGSALYVHGL